MRYLKWSPQELIKNYRLKFDVVFPIEQLTTAYVNVVQAVDRPIFLKKVNWKKVETYFLNEAKKLKKEILK